MVKRELEFKALTLKYGIPHHCNLPIQPNNRNGHVCLKCGSLFIPLRDKLDPEVGYFFIRGKRCKVCQVKRKVRLRKVELEKLTRSGQTL